MGYWSLYPPYVSVAEKKAKAARKLEKLRKTRNNEKVKSCLEELRAKCHSGDNLFPYCLEAVKNRVTLGEIEEAFREEFGLWSFPLMG